MKRLKEGVADDALSCVHNVKDDMLSDSEKYGIV